MRKNALRPARDGAVHKRPPRMFWNDDSASRAAKRRAAMASIEKSTPLKTHPQVSLLPLIARLSANIRRAIVSSLEVSTASGGERECLARYRLLTLAVLMRIECRARKQAVDPAHYRLLTLAVLMR